MPEAVIGDIEETAVAYGARAFLVFDADGAVREIAIWRDGRTVGSVRQTRNGLFEAWHDEKEEAGWKVEKRVRRAVGRAIYGIRFSSEKLPPVVRREDDAAEAPERPGIPVPANGAFQESPFYAAF